MGIVDKVMGSLSSGEKTTGTGTSTKNVEATGPESLADGRPSEVTVDDRIGGTHTRNVKDAVTHERIERHAVHEVTPIVDRTRDETEIHQKVQPVLDSQQTHTHHQHSAPAVHRERGEDISEGVAAKYRMQGEHQNTRQVGEQTHSTSVNAPKVHEHVNKHIVEEIQPVIERETHLTEHHHTTQPITEHHTHAPRVHDTVVNEPISISEFNGGNKAFTSHGATDAVVDKRL